MSTSKEHQFWQKALKATVDHSTNVDDLLLIMRLIPMDKIKTFVKENVDTLDVYLCRSNWYKTTPITDIFPSDVNQHILSFLTFDIDSAEVKTVCKTWNELSHQNEFNYYRNMKKSLVRNEYVEYNPKKNKIWIVDAKRTNLTRAEKKMNFEGPISGIDDEKQAVNSRDVCFVHGAIQILEFSTSVSMIGIGNNAKIFDVDHETDLFIAQAVHFESMTFDFSENHANNGNILIGDAKLTMKNCYLNLGKTYCGIACRVQSTLIVDNCIFDGATTAIEVSPLSNKVDVTDCIFKNCGSETEFKFSFENACVSIDDNNWTDLRRSDANPENFVKLSCVGNVFENNLCYPIAERMGQLSEGDPIYIPTNLYLLKQNVLRGFNGFGLITEIVDANKIYFNDDKFKMSDIW